MVKDQQTQTIFFMNLSNEEHSTPERISFADPKGVPVAMFDMSNNIFLNNPLEKLMNLSQ